MSDAEHGQQRSTTTATTPRPAQVRRLRNLQVKAEDCARLVSGLPLCVFARDRAVWDGRRGCAGERGRAGGRSGWGRPARAAQWHTSPGARSPAIRNQRNDVPNSRRFLSRRRRSARGTWRRRRRSPPSGASARPRCASARAIPCSEPYNLTRGFRAARICIS